MNSSLNQFTDMGLSPSIAQACQFEGPGTSDPMLVLTSDTQFNESELESAASRDVGIIVAPGEAFDLRRLGDSIKRFRRIRLTPGTGRLKQKYVGGEVLERATALEVLSISQALTDSPNLAELPNLTSCVCDGPELRSAARNVNVRVLGGTLTGDSDFYVDAPVWNLALDYNAEYRGRIELASPTSLRKIRVVHAPDFDMEQLKPCVSLEALWIAYSERLRRSATLLSLPKLDEVIFERIKMIDEAADLRSLRADYFRVSDNRSFDDGFLQATADRPLWKIGKYRA